jgi:hypothetical protein
MHAYFFSNVGKRHVFVLHGLGGAGKSQIAFKFVEESQVDAETSRWAIHMFYKFASFQRNSWFYLWRFSEVFFVDASTVETITTDLKSIAVAKGVGDSENDALTCLSRKREEWLLLFNNADDPMLNLRDYFPCCSHGNILITSRNHDIRHHATGQRSHYKVSGMSESDARRLLLHIAGIGGGEHADETETERLASAIIKV